VRICFPFLVFLVFIDAIAPDRYARNKQIRMIGAR
jgi:hypothetical protein